MPNATNSVDSVRTYDEDAGGAGPPVLFYTGFADPLDVAKSRGTAPDAFFRDGDRIFRTYFVNNRGDEAMGAHGATSI